MAASSRNPSEDQKKATKKTPETVNLTPDELRRISGGAKIGPIPPTPTPPAPGNPNPHTPTA